MKTQVLVLSFILTGLFLKAQTWMSYDVANGLANNNVQAIAIDAAGNKWFGTYGGGISKFDGNNWTTYTVDEGLVCDFVRALKFDNAGNLWIGTDGGVSKFDGVNWVNYTTFNGLSNNLVYAIEIDLNGNKWFTTNMGISKFNDVNWTIYTTANGLSNNIVTCIAIDSTNAIWFGTWGGGISKFLDNNWTTYNQVNYVQTIKTDASNGNIWIGTPTDLKMFDGNTWTSYTNTNGLAGNNVTAITIDKFNNKWFGTISEGVSKFDGNTFINYNTNNGLIGYQINCSISENNGNIWIGTMDGVSFYTPPVTKISEIYKPKSFVLFPNPTIDKINISVEPELVGLKYYLTDNTGRNVVSGEVNYISSHIDVSGLEPGIYFLYVSGTSISAYKIVKN
ncbi:MAG: two-component regulator propeller domain-containing protein [Bacteroidota bacterium]|nr:two-component regulator propeller domain-containing protein [Bacteroidota bacterium]MDP3145082.1 two-component regulator propeller domain-containing protein [Bacteroidota bacterium]MDP3556121.1 two-component regulator propeller domain-containing protein [Bacteroidota bacterium]